MLATKAVIRRNLETAYNDSDEGVINSAAWMLSEHPVGTDEAQAAAFEIRNSIWNRWDGGGVANVVTRRIFSDLGRDVDAAGLLDD